MRCDSDVTFADAFEGMQARRDPKQKMTRWQEAESRLHIVMEILCYIPTKGITITFLNAPNVLQLMQAGKTPDQFKLEAHTAITQAFATIEVKYRTPTYQVLTQAFEFARRCPDMVALYFLTDGVPSDASVEHVAQLIKTRPNPDRLPVTLLSCTNVDEECEWMKQVEEAALFCSEVDDYYDEKDEVLKDQGEGFPYSRGFWLLSSLVGAMNPDDIDSMDENLPFTKFTLDNLLGRTHTPQEYQYYFQRNPHGNLYVDMYPSFFSTRGFSRSIISKPEQQQREMRAGYRNGERPNAPLPDISAHLAPFAQQASSGGYSGGYVPGVPVVQATVVG